MANILTKSKILAEDFEFGLDTSEQERTGNQFNASYIPYTVTESVTEALNNRYTSTYLLENFANINGSIAESFLVKDAVASNEAVNYSQLILKADIADVDSKANIAGDNAQRFKVANAIDNDDAINRNQLDLGLLFKDDITSVDAKIAAVYEAIDTKADLNGSDSETFKVSEAINSTDAINKTQLEDRLFTKADLDYTDNNLALKADKDNVLEQDNNNFYNPLFDYNPATKRYVDDSISTALQTGTSGTFVSQDNKTITVVNGLITGII